MSINRRTGNRNRFGSSNRDLGWFTDRHALIRRFTEYVNSDSPTEHILYFYGAGGNGKSLLLDFLRGFCCKRFSPQVWGELQAKSDFAFAEAMTEASDWQYDPILIPALYQDFGERGGDNRPKDGFYGVLQLRRNLGKAAAALGYQLRFPLFDFACLWYLHEKEKLTPERLRELFPADALDVVTETVSLVKEVPGVGLAKALFGVFNRRLGEQWTIFRAKIGLDEAEVERLQSLDPDRELFFEFPDLLARDLNGAMAGGNAPPRVVLLLDTHESFWDEKRDYQGDKFFWQDEWLRRFLAELELADGIIAVVAGRELPRWQDAPSSPIPQDFIEGQWVGDFSLGDAQAYLQKAQINDKALQRAILNYASSAPNQVHPFLLALCVDVVETAHSRGETLTPEDFSSQVEAERKPQILIDRLLRYVDRQVAYAVHALSACRSFDFATYRYLGEQLHFQATQPDFEILTSFSFVREMDAPLIPPTGERTEESNETPSPSPPQSLPKRYRLHDLLRRLDDEREEPTTRRAHEVLEPYCRQQQDISEAIYHANRLDWQRGASEWVTTFDRAVELSQYDDCRALLELREVLNVDSYFQLGSISQSEGDYYTQLAQYQAAEQEYSEAIAAYQKDLENSPDDSSTLNNLGNAFLTLADLLATLSQIEAALTSYQDAIAAYERALQLTPDLVAAHNNRGNTLQSLGDLQARLSQTEAALTSYQDAIASCDRTLQLAPDYINAHNNRGNALLRLGDLQARLSQTEAALTSYQDAIASYERALQLAPDYIGAHNNRGLALQSLGNLQARLSQTEAALTSYQNAIAAYERALQLAPDDVYAHNNRGNALAKLGDLQAGLSQTEAALTSYQNAIASYERALQLAPDLVYALNNLGLGLIKLGRSLEENSQEAEAGECFDKALAAFERSLEIAPGNDYIRNQRDQLLAAFNPEA